jgi:hypothetical protein
MIGIASTIFDTNGARLFNANPAEDAKNRAGERRISRTATLDGGVSVTDFGYSDGDRDVNIAEDPTTQEAVEFARYITETYNRVTVAMEDGAYEAAPKSYGISDGKLSMKLYLIAKLSE